VIPGGDVLAVNQFDSEKSPGLGHFNDPRRARPGNVAAVSFPPLPLHLCLDPYQVTAAQIQVGHRVGGQGTMRARMRTEARWGTPHGNLHEMNHQLEFDLWGSHPWMTRPTEAEAEVPEAVSKGCRRGPPPPSPVDRQPGEPPERLQITQNFSIHVSSGARASTSHEKGRKTQHCSQIANTQKRCGDAYARAGCLEGLQLAESRADGGEGIYIGLSHEEDRPLARTARGGLPAVRGDDSFIGPRPEQNYNLGRGGKSS
jgi:hypothetical protein